MGFFSRNKVTMQATETPAPITNTSDLGSATVRYQQFGTPLVAIGKNDITKPYINSDYGDNSMYIRFGMDNLYPSLIDQMYYQSPLHSTLVDFQINASIGGGWEIAGPEKSGKDKVKELTFLKTIKLKKNVRAIALDIKMHGRSHWIIEKNEAFQVVRATRVIPAKVRYNSVSSKYWISDNWMGGTYHKTIPAYSINGKDKFSMYTYSNVDTSPGQDVYPLPKEVSSFNWCYLDGQSSTLQKKNIEKSIFGTLIIRKPKKFDSTEEMLQFQDSISNKEGEVVPVLVLAADGFDNVPEVQAFPANENDKAFEGMFSRIDEKICQAHSINPVLILEGTGGLGSGSDINAVYPIWEKNVVLPFRSEIEEVVDDLMLIFGITGDFRLNNFQIISGEIVDMTGSMDTNMSADGTTLAPTASNGDSLPQTNSNITGLSAKENADIYRIIRDHSRGKLNSAIAMARLRAYGFDKATIDSILED